MKAWPGIVPPTPPDCGLAKRCQLHPGGLRHLGEIAEREPVSAAVVDDASKGGINREQGATGHHAVKGSERAALRLPVH